MTWHQTIEYIRMQPAFKELVEKAYFEEDLQLNIERFRSSDEYKETLRLIKDYLPDAKNLLDIGSGNGISAISFALDGFKVTVSEPDPSDTVGAGAVRKLKEIYGLNELEVYEEFAENIQFSSGLFDVVYVRQAMHHAYDLSQFVKNLAGLIKPGGLLVTIRDHVVFNEEDKKWFLEMHPLHSFYGGENAFTEKEYTQAIQNAGLEIVKKLKHFESAINYFPLSKEQFERETIGREKEIEAYLVSKFGFLGKWHLLQSLYKKRIGFDVEKIHDETKVPGRMYSFIAVKK